MKCPATCLPIDGQLDECRCLFDRGHEGEHRCQHGFMFGEEVRTDFKNRKGRQLEVRRVAQKKAVVVGARNRIAELLKPLKPRERLQVLRMLKEKLPK